MFRGQLHVAALSLYGDGILDELEPGTFATLRKIHITLFGDIYDSAGMVRDLELKELLRGSLADQLDIFTLLARGVDASYSYEGYAAHRAEDLVQRSIGNEEHKDYVMQSKFKI